MSGGKANNRTLTFTTQNARSLKQNDKIYELITSMKERNTFPTCLQETWRTGFTKLELNGFHLLATGLEPNVVHSRRGEQGVGIMLSPGAFDAWKAANYEICNDLGARVMAIRLLLKDNSKKDVGVYLISAYAPVGNSKQRLWDDFFERLELCIKRKHKKFLNEATYVHSQNMLILVQSSVLVLQLDFNSYIEQPLRHSQVNKLKLSLPTLTL